MRPRLILYWKLTPPPGSSRIGRDWALKFRNFGRIVRKVLLCVDGFRSLPAERRKPPAYSAKHTGGREPTLLFPLCNPLVLGESGRPREPDGCIALLRRKRIVTKMASGLDKFQEIAERVAQSS